MNMEWISVKDRLPESVRLDWGVPRCLAVVGSGKNAEVVTVTWHGGDSVDCFWIEGIGWADSDLTHWMPLPPPPKEGE